MAKGNLIISCGGGGKGVLNFVKKSLVGTYGSVADAGVVLLAVDGPPPEKDGWYLLPDGSSLSSVPADKEFFGLTKDPKPIIEAISQAATTSDPAFPYVSGVVTRHEARVLIALVPSMNPASGMGGCRPVGHANFRMEAPEIQQALDDAFKRARPMVQTITDDEGKNVNQLNVFLVGCQFGGTGAGQLLDLGQLVRSLMGPRERLILVLILPDAYDGVIKPNSDPRAYADAKGYCGLREVARMRKSLGIMDTIEYAKNVTAAYSHLFDVCFLVDGASETLDLSAYLPMQGVIPTVADLITSMIVDDRHITTQVINWTSTSLARRHYSTVGSHIWVFPAERLTSDYALQFTETVYQTILQEGDAGARARDRMLKLMNSTLFTQLAIDLSEQRELPTSPPEWRALRPRLTVPISPPEWPRTPGFEAWYLPSEVKHAQFILGGPTNADVKRNCDDELNQYLGKSGDAYETTVHGWLSVNSLVVRRTFVDELVQLIRDLFYERDSKGVYSPRPLAQQPNSIVEAAHFLRSTLNMLGDQRVVLERDLREKGQVPDPDNPGQRVAVSTLARRRVDEIGTRMESGKDPQLQADYIAASQVYLEARLWEIIMEAGERLAADLLELVKVSWGWVGDSASGWQTYLSDVCLKSVQTERINLRSIAAAEDRIACRTSYPRAGSVAERQLFADIVKGLNLVESALGKLSWGLTEVRSPTGDPKRDLEGRQLLLRTGIDVPPATQHQLVVATDLIQGAVREEQLHIHTPEMIRSFGAQQISPRISQLTIWDALYYVYRHGWLAKKHSGAAPTDALLQEFVQTRVQRLNQKSGPLFRNAGRASDHPVYCFSHFRTDESQVGQLAAAFQSELSRTFAEVHELPGMDSELRVARFANGLDDTDWSYLDTACRRYYAHESDGELPTAQVYPNEKYAYLLEGIIADEIRHSERRPLPPEITCLMNDHDVFETFALAFLAGLFDPVEDPRNPGAFPDLGVMKPRQIVLGAKIALHEVAQQFLAKTGPHARDAETVREVVNARLKEKLASLSDEAARKGFFDNLVAAARSPNLFSANETKLDTKIPWDAWRDVFIAIAIKRAGAYQIKLTV